MSGNTGTQDIPDGPFIPTANMSNAVPMVDDATLVASEHSAYNGDLAVLAIANNKTAVRFWDAGSFKNGTPSTGDMIVMTDTMSITSSGNAVFNLTGDHTSTGTALCSSILANSCVANFVDSTGVYSQGAPTIAGNLKTVTIATTKQTQAGVIVATITVIGSITQPSSPNSTVVKFFGIGIAA